MATKIAQISTLVTADDKPMKRGLVKARGNAKKGAKKIQDELNGINLKSLGIDIYSIATAGQIMPKLILLTLANYLKPK